MLTLIQQVAQGLAQIVNVVSNDVSAMLVREQAYGHPNEISELTAHSWQSVKTAPFGNKDAEAVVEVLTAFVKVHQELLNTVSASEIVCMARTVFWQLESCRSLASTGSFRSSSSRSRLQPLWDSSRLLWT
jgi:hypothetical protein